MRSGLFAGGDVSDLALAHEDMGGFHNAEDDFRNG